MITREEALARVQEGMKYLDETAEGWRGKVDLSSLRIEDSDNCLLKQVFGEYRTLAGDREALDLQVSRGFTTRTSVDDNWEDLRLLDEVWKEELAKVL